MKKQALYQTLTFCVLASLCSLALAVGELYRYKGVNGETVIDDHIPPEFVSKGYTILSSTGMVIETVAPALTGEEKAKAMEEERKKMELEEVKRKRKEEDEWLLQRFSDAGDAVRARDRQLGSLETLIVVAQSNIKKLKKDEAKELSYAAAAERSGKEVPQDVLDNLKSIREQIRAAETQIETQRDEQEKIKYKYEGMIQRLKEIEEEQAKAK